MKFDVTKTIPTQGMVFRVDPEMIRKSSKLFRTTRNDPKQDEIRMLILEALKESEENTIWGGNKPFYTLIPKKDWERSKSIIELKAYANYLEGMMANWVEQALEWAQRIINGESWEELCNNPDKIDSWYRVVEWRDHYYRVVGDCHGSREIPATEMQGRYSSSMELFYTVPLVVFYEE